MSRLARLLGLALLAIGLVALAAVVAGLVASEEILRWRGYKPAGERLVTGILVAGTRERPVLYATSSDPRIGGEAGDDGEDGDTSSGVVSLLTRTERGWERLDLVRGLPRSRADHGPNGLALDARRGVLYVAQGSNTNMGAPSRHFGGLPEYALSGAILAIDLRRIAGRTYDVPTLDGGGPFGGRGGSGQARLPLRGPVSIHAPGFRNPYDLVLTRSGRLYVTDNGPNLGWGGLPAGEGPRGRCSSAPREGGVDGLDTLHRVPGPGYYGGHPNPERGRTDPRQCDYVPPARRPALARFDSSTNGLAEYTARNLGGALEGDLLTVSLDGRLTRLELSPGGDEVVRRQTLALLQTPLDVTAQGPGDVFPGTIWIAGYGPQGRISVLEPRDAAGWRSLPSPGLRRQEVSYVELDGKLYLAGGDRRHQLYDPASRTWRDLAPLPARLDHVQGVALGGRIYYVGGLERWPKPHSGTVFVYDPASDSFSEGAPMPRPRGAGGVAAYGGRIYYAGGLHDGEAVAWFDVYDPAMGRWRELEDMPRARDHFQAVVVGDRLYAIGGRDRDLGRETGANDAFDFTRGEWVTGLAPLPTPRGGFAAAAVGNEILVIGGETKERAHATVEAYDTETDRWRALDPLPTPRHGIQAAVCGGAVYVAAGGREPGGDAPTDVHEVFLPQPGSGCGPASETDAGAVTPGSFRTAVLEGASPRNPTSLQLGPDGRLYVAQQDGLILAYTVARVGEGRYAVTATERIDLVRRIPNHDDDGSSATDFGALVDRVLDAVGLG